MIGLMVLTDKVLRESELFSSQDAQAQAKQAEVLAGFLAGPENEAAGCARPTQTMRGDEGGRDCPRVLGDLKSLVDSFPSPARRRVIADIRSVLETL